MTTKQIIYKECSWLKAFVLSLLMPWKYRMGKVNQSNAVFWEDQS